MTSPVVRTGFGSRPLLEVPAMEVAAEASQMAVNSLMAQGPHRAPAVELIPEARAVLIGPTTIVAAPPAQSHQPAVPPAPLVPGPYNHAPPNPFPTAVNPMTGSGLYNIQPVGFPTNPAALQPFSTFDRRHHSVTQGPLYNSQGKLYYYGPNGEIIFPPPVYAGVANPFTGAAPNAYTHPHGFNPYGGQVSYPGFEPRPFSVTCELEFGRIVTINLKDSIGEFRGIPDFIRLELLRTYGTEAFTEVKIKYTDGEFHIYANNEKMPKPEREAYSETDSISDYGETDVDPYARIKPRNGRQNPRRIVHTRGWNRFR